MDNWERELLISKIVSGVFYLKINNISFFIDRPTIKDIHRANLIYEEVYRDAILTGILTEDELLKFLVEQEFWDFAQEEKIESLKAEISETKKMMYENILNENILMKYRLHLDVIRPRYISLLNKRHSFDHLTCNGIALQAKQKYLIRQTLKLMNSRHFYKKKILFDSSDEIVDQALMLWNTEQIDDKDIREISRTEPWRSIWSCRMHVKNLFDVPAIELTEPQKNLILYSYMYDQIQQHPEKPPDMVIEDDDLLDGWLIYQKEKSEKETNNNLIDEKLKGSKINDYEEIFLVVGNEKDAEKVYKRNDASGKIALFERFNQLKKDGIVNEEDFLETRKRVNMQLAQMEADRWKN